MTRLQELYRDIPCETKIKVRVESAREDLLAEVLAVVDALEAKYECVAGQIMLPDSGRDRILGKLELLADIRTRLAALGAVVVTGDPDEEDVRKL